RGDSAGWIWASATPAGPIDCNTVVIIAIYLLRSQKSGPRGQKDETMQSFLNALRTQRWDDHRYYHHSRINQSLHLLSAMSFLAAYVTIFRNPAASGFIGWLFAMVSRQAGHFFFEPK